jgi:hypothetical protein
MEEAVNYNFSNVVVHHYIIIALDSHNEGDEERSQFCYKVMVAKV